MKIAICCYSYLLSEGIKRLIERESLVKVARCQNDDNIKEIADLRPDLIIADLETFLDHSEDLLNKGQSKVLVINNTARLPSIEGRLSEFIAKGLVGILPPETDALLLKRAISTVSKGELWIDRKSIKDMLMSGRQKVSLTRQEGQVVYHICRGYRNKEIAKKLDITEQTVKSHCNRIYRKYGVSDRLHLAVLLMHDKSVLE
jgi:two-component system nitrate/nitrite response regulator NarL